jgi:hypothetical protein
LGLGALISGAVADVYMQNPRGSNNRLDEANRDRNNGNRLFDSQNNNRGGYNVGQVYYYTGSMAVVDWTNQHSCGNPNNNCEMIIQYMCDDLIRDGTSTKTIPTNPAECNNNDCDTDPEYGRQESAAWYQNCINRERNKGLFIANQNLNNRRDARYTRQNPNGNRRGYECPEERDYYPYWHPSPWVDAAVLTNQANRCQDYREKSQNVASTWYCDVPWEWVAEMRKTTTGFIPITKEGCNATEVGTWTEMPAKGVAAPICHENYWSRDNHLGNVESGFPANLNWTIPNLVHERCVLRIRYNISTGEYEGFEAMNSAESGVAMEANSVHKNPNPNNDPAELDVWTKYGLERNDSLASFDRSKNDNQEELKASREYVFKNNPRVNIFGPDIAGDKVIKLQLAINTNQFGRTFQDRSHRFAIRERPAALADQTIHNVQVQGKRGNIVQTFPGTEYDFSPYRLEAMQNDYVHFQWTGSDTNPNNNAGQGRQGTDRSNVILSRWANFEEGQPDEVRGGLKTMGQFGNSYFHEVADVPFLGLNEADRLSLATLNTKQFGGEMSELDDSGTYFDLGPRQMTTLGVYHYLCTRNNNFSNRSQKGKIVVSNTGIITSLLGLQGGEVEMNGAKLTAPWGSLNQLTTVTMSYVPPDSPGATVAGVEASGPYILVRPLEFQATQSLVLEVPYSENYLGAATLLRSDTIDGRYSEVSADHTTGLATAKINRGGVYVVEDALNLPAIIIVTLVCLVVITLTSYKGYMYYKSNRGDASHHQPAVQPKIVPVGEDDAPWLAPQSSTDTDLQSVQKPSSGAMAIAPAPSNELPDGWSVAYKDGTPYYVNFNTGETRWEYPTDA